MAHVFLYKLKVLLRDKPLIFWTLIFPIILATLFNMAFSNLSSSEQFKDIRVGIIDDDIYKAEENFKSLIDELSNQDNEDKLLETYYYENEDEAKEALNNNDIVGYYLVTDEINVIVKNSGTNQTILKQLVKEYYQTYSIIENVIRFNPMLFNEELIGGLNEDNNFVNINSNNIDETVIYFYSLIGMICLYGTFFGFTVVNEIEANLSKRAARFSVSPTNKIKVLFISLVVALVVQYLEVLILLFYLVFVLGINFANQLGLILLLTFIGCIAGISLGILIGVSNKKSENAKVGISLAITMTCSFLSGMMAIDIKYLIDEYVPIISKINPVNMITDGLYSLYYYDTLDRYYSNIISLMIFALVMMSISYMFIRRKKYDSI